MPGRIDAILAIEDPTAFAIALGNHIYQLDGEGDFAGLSEAEQTVYCIDGLERDVNNGGFSQFYLNSSGDQAVETVAALERIGATRMAALVRDANAAFGPSGPARDRDERGTQLLALGDAADAHWQALSAKFWDYPDDLTALVRAYVSAHRGEFRE